jgi:hypothetical protein
MPKSAIKHSAHAIAIREFVAHERLSALAMIAYHLDQILAHVRAAAHYNLTHDLQLELPSETELVELIGECVAKQRRETGV